MGSISGEVSWVVSVLEGWRASWWLWPPVKPGLASAAGWSQGKPDVWSPPGPTVLLGPWGINFRDCRGAGCGQEWLWMAVGIVTLTTAWALEVWSPSPLGEKGGGGVYTMVFILCSLGS